MNKTLESITARRSVRKYLDKPVPKQLLEAVTNAGIQAPSAHNAQNLHFTIITSKDKIDELSAKSKAAMALSDNDWAKNMSANSVFHIFYDAPAVIIVSAGPNCLLPEEDSSAAVENMLIAAASLELGSCWIGLANFHFQTLTDYSCWSIPDEYKPLQTICLGYPDNSAPSVKAPRKNISISWL